MRIGYALASSSGDDAGEEGPGYWRTVLEENGCTAVYTDTHGPASSDGPAPSADTLAGALPEREVALARLQQGDVLVTPRLALLGRSFEELAAVFREVDRRGAELWALEEDLRTDIGGGEEALSQVLQAFASFEKEQTRLRPSGPRTLVGGAAAADIDDLGDEQKRLKTTDTSGESSREAGIGDTAERSTDAHGETIEAEEVVDTVRESLLILSADLHVASANRSFYELFQTRPEKTLGRKVYDLGDGQWDIPALRQLLEEVLPEQKSFLDYEVAHDFDRIGGRVMLLNARPVDRQQLILLAIEDVTEAKRIKEELRRSEQQLRSVVENVRDVIFRVDTEGRCTFLNPAWEELTGYSVEETLGTPLSKYVPPEKREQAHEGFQRHLSGDATGTDLDDEGLFVKEGRLVTAGGEVRWTRLSARRLTDETGQVIGTAGTITDLTDSKRAEAEQKARERAEELLAAKTTFLGNMSHELRTPLTSILGYANLLAGETTSDEHQTFASCITESGQRLKGMVESILHLTELDARGAGLSMGRVPVAEVVRKAAEVHRPAAEAKGLTFVVETPPATEEAGLTHAALNEGALDRVLDNLIGNAVKFTKPGGQVAVRTRSCEGTEEGVCVRVEDTGIGIGEAFQANGLFKEFRQESTGLSRSHEGAGLGLAITQRLVERMDGQIEVESAKGEGATFTLRFLRMADAAAQEEESPSPASVAGESGAGEDDAEKHSSRPPSPAVLVVEDNANTRALAERFLRPASCVVSSAASVDEALEAAKRNDFDVFLIDINLDGLEDGVQLLHRLCALQGYAEAPAIAFTALAMPDDEQRLLEAGFDDYLGKPFSQRELLAAVETHLEVS